MGRVGLLSLVVVDPNGMRSQCFLRPLSRLKHWLKSSMRLRTWFGSKDSNGTRIQCWVQSVIQTNWHLSNLMMDCFVSAAHLRLCCPSAQTYPPLSLVSLDSPIPRRQWIWATSEYDGNWDGGCMEHCKYDHTRFLELSSFQSVDRWMNLSQPSFLSHR